MYIHMHDGSHSRENVSLGQVHGPITNAVKCNDHLSACERVQLSINMH